MMLPKGTEHKYLAFSDNKKNHKKFGGYNMEDFIILSKDEEQRRKEVARIMREETFYSVSRDDVLLESCNETCTTYSAMLVIANESGDGVHYVEIFYKFYHHENRYEITVQKW